MKNIVVGQRVRPEKVECAKALRRTMTRAEEVLWQHLRSNRLAGLHFRRQQIVRGLVVDFYCHAAALVIEVDGDIHDQQQAHDQEREQLLNELGFRVLRFRNEDVEQNLTNVLECIQRAALPLPASGRGPGG
jgi:very-short-patch-repair endonuclease